MRNPFTGVTYVAYLPRLTTTKTVLCCALLGLLIGALAADLAAGPPSPQLLERLREEGRLQQLADRLADARARGMISPDMRGREPLTADGRRYGSGAKDVDSMRAVMLLIDFTYNQAPDGGAYGTAAAFQEKLWSNDPGDDHYSMTEFYLENSYGNFVVYGDVYGWFRMPQTYAYYVDGQQGWGDYPQNNSRMVEDAVNLADPTVDFSLYDNNGDNYVEALFIVVAGQGADWTGSQHQIWPHMGCVWYPQTVDGVTCECYSMEVEELTSSDDGLETIGLFSHEFGHQLGLPDLYDVTYESNGIGDWGLMSFGSWNDGGDHPAFFTAWCKYKLGWLDPINVTENQINVLIDASIDQPIAYRLWTFGAMGDQYFLVENRVRAGNDLYIPGSGLLVMHLDETQWGNEDCWHPLLGIEQADGRFDLQERSNKGDSRDPWWAPHATSFDDLSVPDSRDYDSIPTRVSVWNVSEPGWTMTANLDIDWSRPRLGWAGDETSSWIFEDPPPGGDGDGHLDPGETVEFYCALRHGWLPIYNARMQLSCNHPAVTVTTPEVVFSDVMDNQTYMSSEPVMVTLATSFEPTIDSFYLTMVCDSLPGAPGTNDFEQTFIFESNIGPPEVLIVDDDDGNAYDEEYRRVVYDQRKPHIVWHVEEYGPPELSTLQEYPMVFWHTGDERPNAITTYKIDLMKSYMDSGGALLLSTITGVLDIVALDPDFLTDYFGAEHVGSAFVPAFVGVDGNPVGDATQYFYGGSAPNTPQQTLSAVAPGEAAFTLYTTGHVVGVTYTGSHNSVLLSVPVEYVRDDFGGWDPKDTLLTRIADFLKTPSEGCCLTRGDIDHSGPEVDIADLVYLVNYMFKSGPEPPCMEEADINGDGADQVNITDLVCLVNYMFKEGPEPVPCP